MTPGGRLQLVVAPDDNKPIRSVSLPVGAVYLTLDSDRDNPYWVNFTYRFRTRNPDDSPLPTFLLVDRKQLYEIARTVGGGFLANTYEFPVDVRHMTPARAKRLAATFAATQRLLGADEPDERRTRVPRRPEPALCFVELARVGCRARQAKRRCAIAGDRTARSLRGADRRRGRRRHRCVQRASPRRRSAALGGRGRAANRLHRSGCSGIAAARRARHRARRSGRRPDRACVCARRNRRRLGRPERPRRGVRRCVRGDPRARGRRLGGPRPDDRAHSCSPPHRPSLGGAGPPGRRGDLHRRPPRRWSGAQPGDRVASPPRGAAVPAPPRRGRSRAALASASPGAQAARSSLERALPRAAQARLGANAARAPDGDDRGCVRRGHVRRGARRVAHLEQPREGLRGERKRRPGADRFAACAAAFVPGPDRPRRSELRLGLRRRLDGRGDGRRS